MVNGMLVAIAEQLDAESPSDLTILYRAAIPMDSEVEVIIVNEDGDVTIDMRFLQWGYKLYGPGYNIISVLDTACV